MVATPYILEQRERWLVARLHEPGILLSWCVVNGGFQRAQTLAWLYLQDDEIAAVDHPAEWLRARMHAEGLSGAVGFMTSRRRHRWVESNAEEMDCQAWAVGTVGLSNLLRAGDPATHRAEGTINLLVCVSQPLTMEAAIEALSLAGEAKALAVLESGMRSVVSQAPATGTGTDYMALAWPATGTPQSYAGKHTAVGAAIGRAVFALVRGGIDEWRSEQGGPR